MSSRTVRVVNVALVLVFLGLCVACGGVQQAAARSKRVNDMKMIGIAYYNFHDANNKPPSNAQDLLTIDPTVGPAVALIQSGEVIFIFDAKLSDMMQQGSSNVVLAYEAKAPNSGGVVLLGDGSVKQMTAAEFQAAPKAQPKK
jgi:hypothetical protein